MTIYLVDLTQNKVVSRHRTALAALDADAIYHRQIARLGGGAYARTRLVQWDGAENALLNRLLEDQNFRGVEPLE